MFVRLRMTTDGAVYARLVKSVREGKGIHQKMTRYLGKFYPGEWQFRSLYPLVKSDPGPPDQSKYLHNRDQLKKLKKALASKPWRFEAIRKLIEKLDGKDSCEWEVFKFGELFGRHPRINRDGKLRLGSNEMLRLSYILLLEKEGFSGLVTCPWCRKKIPTFAHDPEVGLVHHIEDEHFIVDSKTGRRLGHVARDDGVYFHPLFGLLTDKTDKNLINWLKDHDLF